MFSTQMKRIFTLVVLVALGFVLSCQSSLREIATPEPTGANVAVSGKPFLALNRGYGVYMKHCSQCHEHRLPNTITLPAWHEQIELMSDLAGLSKMDKKTLQTYLGEFSDR